MAVSGPVLKDFLLEMPDFSGLSPAPFAAASQERAEQILADRAAELAADIMFSTELVSFRQDDEAVIAELRDTATGDRQTITARYLVGADGHKGTIRDMAAIPVHGRRSSRPERTMFLQFEADLEVALRGEAFGLFYLQNPALPARAATVVTTDHPGRYVLAARFEPEDAPDAERLMDVVRTACGVPDLSVKILEAAWSSSGEHVTRVADAFQAGRVLLAGDSAHLMPPTGGQGGNAAVMDGYHLAWKLAAVLSGTAGAGLLASHDGPAPSSRPYDGSAWPWTST
ncbi:FAD-dependent monooxygenase [Microbispora amethystogenes]|nr:FAD-dependent monooxygenase [Microbispora amethystogenes]